MDRAREGRNVASGALPCRVRRRRFPGRGVGVDDGRGDSRVGAVPKKDPVLSWPKRLTRASRPVPPPDRGRRRRRSQARRGRGGAPVPEAPRGGCRSPLPASRPGAPTEARHSAACHARRAADPRRAPRRQGSGLAVQRQGKKRGRKAGKGVLS